MTVGQMTPGLNDFLPSGVAPLDIGFYLILDPFIFSAAVVTLRLRLVLFVPPVREGP